MTYLTLTAIAFLLLVVSRRRPTHNKNWRPEQSRLPSAKIKSNTIKIKDIRNFTFHSESNFDQSYYDKEFDLNQLVSLDYIHQPFHRMPLAAHTFLSFGFSNGDYISISFEARRKKGAGFSSIKGLLRYFGLIYIVADEKDILRLRALHHRDKIYIYPLKASPEKIQALFLDIIERINRIKEKPEFYNTLLSTCATNLVKHVNNIFYLNIAIGPKVLLPAFADRLIYKFGLVDTELSFKEARKKFLINKKIHKFADHPDFSRKIRTTKYE